MRKGYLSHRQLAKAQASMYISAVLPEPWPFADVVETLR